MVETLALWIVTHTLAEELFSGRRKPFSCQFCLSGWTCLTLISVGVLRTETADNVVPLLAWWAGSVLLEAVYQWLYRIVL